MGCSDSTPKMSLTEEYVKAGLQMPAFSEYENEYEKQIYFAINMCRYNPAGFVPYVRDASKHPGLAKVPESVVKNLIEYLKKAEHLRPVYFDDQAMEAVRKNNKEKIALNQEQPDLLGNVDAYLAIAGEDKKDTVEEFTIFNWENPCAQILVAFQLIHNWNREGEAHFHSPILDENTTRVGISNKPHQQCVNLIQILYVKKVPTMLE